MFATGILKIELHPKLNRLYVQCINDPLIYVIEATSAIVIQTIHVSNDLQSFSNLIERKIFTISPCGSLIFMNNSQNHEIIECFQLSNEEKIGQYPLPISIATRTFRLTSISCHPTKNLMACTIFGDSITSNLFVLCHESVKATPSITANSMASTIKHSGEMINSDALHTFRSTSDSHTNASNAIASILEQIDDLFFMAVQSPSHISDFERLKDMQFTLQKLQISTERRASDHCQTDKLPNSMHTTEASNSDVSYSNNVHAHSQAPIAQHTHCKQYDTLNNVAETAGNIYEHASSSNASSKHTFVLERAPVHTQQTNGHCKNDMNNTYSISSASEQSDLVSEINNSK